MLTGSAEPEGLGGWLIPVGLGLVLTPVRGAWFFFDEVPALTSQGLWQELTTPGTAHYHRLWSPLILLEMTGNVLITVLAVVLVVLFFSRSRFFPVSFIVYLGFNAAFVLADSSLAQQIPAVAQLNDPEMAKDLFRAITGALVWIPYCLMSRRVSNTFVN